MSPTLKSTGSSKEIDTVVPDSKGEGIGVAPSPKTLVAGVVCDRDWETFYFLYQKKMVFMVKLVVLVLMTKTQIFKML